MTSPSTGTEDRAYGEDWNKLIDHLTGVSATDPLTFNIDQHNLKDSATNTTGDLLKGNGTKFIRFPKGSAGQVLKVNTGGTDLEWGTSGGGTWDPTATETLTNKTINTTDNSVTATSQATGDLLKGNGTKFVRMGRGTAGQVLKVNTGGTDLEWGTDNTGGGGGGISGRLSYWYMYIDTADASKVKATNGTTTIEHANDAAEVILDVFDAMGTTPFYIKVAPGNFIMRSWSQTRSRKGKFTIEGSGMDVTNFLVNQEIDTVAGQNNVFGFWAATSTYTANNLSSNASKNAATVSASTNTGLVAGAYVVIRDTTADKNGEINRVVSISGSGPYTVVLEKRTRGAYVTTSAAAIQRIDFLTDISLRDFTIKRDSNFTGGISFLSFDYADNVNVDRVKLHDFQRGGFHVALVTTSVINSRFRMHFGYPPEAGDFTNGWGYAISCRSACENVWYYPFFYGGIRHGFTTTGRSGYNGEPRNIHICDGNSDTTGEQSYDTHGEGDGIYFERCTVYSFRNANGPSGTDDTSAFGTRCKNTVFNGCAVVNSWGVGFGISAVSTGSKVINCYVRNIVEGNNPAIQIQASDCQVLNNEIEDCDGKAIAIDGAIKNIQVNGNRIRNVNKTQTLEAAIDLSGTASFVQINDNNISDCPNDAIRLQGSNHDCTFNDNIIDTVQESGVKITDSLNCVGTGNRIGGCDRGLEMTGTSDRIIWVGNNTRSNTNAKITVGANNVIANNQE